MSREDPSTSVFRFVHPVTVRFRDIDVGGHAHHSTPLMYIEEARWAYWKEVAGRDGIESVDYIMAEAHLRYRRRVRYPGVVHVGVRVVSLGRKHFEMDYEVRDEEGDLLVSASTVQVMYDYRAGASISVPDELRARLETFEGGPLPRRRAGDPPGPQDKVDRISSE
jgi:acyl-CoA thioester hydrolase